MAKATVTRQRGRFFARFLDVAGKDLTVPLVAKEAEQAQRDADFLAVLCEGLRFGLPTPVRPPAGGRAVFFCATKLGSASTLVKIAEWAAIHIERRLQQLQGDAPTPVVLIAWRPGALLEEREEHRRWAMYRERGGWFRLEGQLQAYVDQLRAALVLTEPGSPRLAG